MSIFSESLLMAMPTSARALLRGFSEMEKTTVLGRFALNQRTVATTVLAISSIDVGIPSSPSSSR